MQSLNNFKFRRASFLLALVFTNIIYRCHGLLVVSSYNSQSLVPVSAQRIANRKFRSADENYRTTSASRCVTSLDMSSSEEVHDPTSRRLGPPHVETVLFVECGFGNDSHGQSATKAAVRACRNAIEFNSIPSVSRLVPNGREGLRLDVVLAIPPKYQNSLELSPVSEVFPYGSIRFQIQDGGMIAPSGIAIKELGDENEDMVVVCAAVTVGY
mmetsp:Transcript_4555/g.5272  ORF Transcript_4555/g.5272 Transcript_4555/m.5272 type:complete len:213 (-) Transcript_4555:203-841(-)